MASTLDQFIYSNSDAQELMYNQALQHILHREDWMENLIEVVEIGMNIEEQALSISDIDRICDTQGILLPTPLMQFATEYIVEQKTSILTIAKNVLKPLFAPYTTMGERYFSNPLAETVGDIVKVGLSNGYKYSTYPGVTWLGTTVIEAVQQFAAFMLRKRREMLHLYPPYPVAQEVPVIFQIPLLTKGGDPAILDIFGLHYLCKCHHTYTYLALESQIIPKKDNASLLGYMKHSVGRLPN